MAGLPPASPRDDDYQNRNNRTTQNNREKLLQLRAYNDDKLRQPILNEKRLVKPNNTSTQRRTPPNLFISESPTRI